jgi:CheY-like chemotaxis protein
MRQVLIVDDHPGFRRLRPAAVLLDVLLPGRDGFRVA